MNSPENSPSSCISLFSRRREKKGNIPSTPVRIALRNTQSFLNSFWHRMKELKAATSADFIIFQHFKLFTKYSEITPPRCWESHIMSLWTQQELCVADEWIQYSQFTINWPFTVSSDFSATVGPGPLMLAYCVVS